MNPAPIFIERNQVKKIVVALGGNAISSDPSAQAQEALETAKHRIN